MVQGLAERGPACEPADGAREAGEREADREALEALGRGDRRAAIAALMKEHGDALYRYCHKVLRSRTLADDVHQLVFVQAFRDLDAFSRASSLRAWLYAIANHRCLDALKVRRRFLARFTLREELHDAPDPAPSNEDEAARRSLAAALEGCLGELAPHVRIAVLLRYQEGFTYEEMGRMCHERPATLQARVARAMPLLRRCLEGKGVEP